MKRELAAASPQRSACCNGDAADDDSKNHKHNGTTSSSCKPYRITKKINGFIVYTRVKKFKKQRCDADSDKEVIVATEVNTEVATKEISLAEMLRNESKKLANGVLKKLCNNKSSNGRPKRLSKSTLKVRVKKEEDTPKKKEKGLKAVEVEVKVNGLESVDGGEMSIVDVEMIAEGSALSSTPKKNLELKMSKKIALDSVPMTVRELFETGLLEGVPVIYMGGKKFQSFGLRGIIKDVGILCTCLFCNGRRVIPPSQFEIHAIKQYRRAAQYICFENGKSLLDVLNICRYSPLDSLEATIQSAVSGLPVEKTFTCKRCKGTFPSIRVGNVGPLCNLCVDSKESQSSPACESSIKARSEEPIWSLEHSRSASVSTSSLDNTSQKIKRKRKRKRKSKLDPSMRPSRSAPVRMARKRSLWNITSGLIPYKFRSPSPDTYAKPSISSFHLASQKKKQKVTPRKSKSISLSQALKNAPVGLSPQNKYQMKITTKDQRLHKLVFEQDGLPDGTEVAYYARGQKLLVGYKRGYGILCRCCNCEVSPSTFEAHAGWAARKKPYAYIYTSNGVSLHELAISLSKGRRFCAKDNDDLCIICGDGGNLLLCDGCPRAFHKGCASLPNIPHGDWYCQYCQNMYQREKFVEYNANAIAAGRVSGVDPIEEISQRCIRIVKHIEAELTGCALCRGYDFSRSGFGPRTIILCDQCEKEFHVGCLRNHKIANLKELPKGKWFCCHDCSRINNTLQKLLVGGAEKLPDSLLNIIRKKNEENGVETTNDVDVRWMLLSGKVASPENKLLLSQALSIFQECFDPIIDLTTGRDLIPLMVYGKNSKDQDYAGMFCAVLLVGSRVVSAGILRVFGQEVAELPLVATSNGNHGKGYFQLLFSRIEQLLSLLDVQNLVLPAAEEAESIWIDKFGFYKIDPDQLGKYRKSCWQIVTFEGTSMLHKPIPGCRIISQSIEPLDCFREEVGE